MFGETWCNRVTFSGTPIYLTRLRVTAVLHSRGNSDRRHHHSSQPLHVRTPAPSLTFSCWCPAWPCLLIWHPRGAHIAGILISLEASRARARALSLSLARSLSLFRSVCLSVCLSLSLCLSLSRALSLSLSLKRFDGVHSPVSAKDFALPQVRDAEL